MVWIHGCRRQARTQGNFVTSSYSHALPYKPECKNSNTFHIYFSSTNHPSSLPFCQVMAGLGAPEVSQLRTTAIPSITVLSRGALVMLGAMPRMDRETREILLVEALIYHELSIKKTTILPRPHPKGKSNTHKGTPNKSPDHSCFTTFNRLVAVSYQPSHNSPQQSRTHLNDKVSSKGCCCWWYCNNSTDVEAVENTALDEHPSCLLKPRIPLFYETPIMLSQENLFSNLAPKPNYCPSKQCPCPSAFPRVLD